MKLSELLRKNKIYISLPCGGCGACGKCKVRLSDGSIVLACKTEVDEDYDISGVTLLDNEAKISALSVDRTASPTAYTTSDSFGIAIDIGTTTVAFALVEGDGSVADTICSINPQRTYGADVIGRIKASNEGCKQVLQTIIIDCINKNIDILIQRNKIRSGLIRRVVIAGNTTMIHLLRGYSCQSLGKYPFTPHSVSGETVPAEEVLGRRDLDHVLVYILPGISAFVGGDIVSGIYASKMCASADISLLIDLGTNGEMVIGNKNRIVATSTAAGPAFEGGNISIGVPSIPGAIYDTNIIGRNRLQTRTIDGKTPIGLCGSGLISIVSDLLDAGIIDSDGMLSEGYFDEGYPLLPNIRLIQQDIRELQLAKSAVRVGIELLCREYGIESGEITNIYLAGGFGNGLDIKKAMNIGLIPKSCTSVKAIGNSSLKGAILCAREDTSFRDMANIATKCQTLLIANEDDFNDKYLHYMSFDREV